MFELFSDVRTANIILHSDEECIKLAALDLRENLLSLSGKISGFEIVTEPRGVQPRQVAGGVFGR